MRVFCAALCVVAFACLYSFPLRADNCMPLADHMAYAKTQSAVVDVLPLEGDKLQKVIAYIQAINGDDGKYDTGYLAWSVSHVAIFLGNGGQICSVFVGPVQHLPRMIEAAEGRPA